MSRCGPAAVLPPSGSSPVSLFAGFKNERVFVAERCQAHSLCLTRDPGGKSKTLTILSKIYEFSLSLFAIDSDGAGGGGRAGSAGPNQQSAGRRRRAATSPAGGTNVTDIGTTTVVGHFNEVRTQIMPSLGATESVKDETQILSMSQGADAPVNQVITRFPGVAEDSAANGDLHVRGEHANLQYRIDDVLLPEGITGFGLELDPRFIQSIKLITGSLPAQYGFRTAGMVDIQTKNGALNPGGEVSLYGGSYDTFRPSFEYGGSEGKFNYFMDGSYDHNAIGHRESRRPVPRPIHDHTEQWKTFLYGSYIIDDTSRITTMAQRVLQPIRGSQHAGPCRRAQIPGFTTWASAMTGANVPGYTGAFNSAKDNENQNEENYYTPHSAGREGVISDF